LLAGNKDEFRFQVMGWDSTAAQFSRLASLTLYIPLCLHSSNAWPQAITGVQHHQIVECWAWVTSCNSVLCAVQGADVGALQSATVRLVERGVDAAWWLGRLEVTRPDNGSSAVFVHDGWLQQSKGNPAVQVTLTAQQQQLVQAVQQQQVQQQQVQQQEPVLPQGQPPQQQSPKQVVATQPQQQQQQEQGSLAQQQQQGRQAQLALAPQATR
jgi:hypothetical protein